jgi:hypothetical protein
MSTVRVSSTPWIADSVVVGDVGGGVAASTVPSTGENGPALLYQFVVDNTLTTEEVRALITSPPVDGDLFVYEDTSFVYDGPVPASFTIQPYVDYVATGDAIVVNISSGSVSFTTEAGSFTITGGDVVFAANTGTLLDSGTFTLAGGNVNFSYSNAPRAFKINGVPLP